MSSCLVAQVNVNDDSRIPLNGDLPAGDWRGFEELDKEISAKNIGG